MATSTPPAEPRHLRLCDFIETRQEEILQAWEAAVRKDAAMERLSPPKLRDHIPTLLRRISEMVRAVHTGGPASLGDAPTLHALHRLDSGLDLQTVVNELAELRQTILSLWDPHTSFSDGRTVLAEVKRLDSTIDLVVTQSVEKYVRARQRTLTSLDRIASWALGQDKLATSLPELLKVVLDTTEAADCASLFLRENDELVLKAAVGINAEHNQEQRIPIGEGFVGKIAAEKQPRSLSEADREKTGPLAEAEIPPILALYGVPLLHEGALLGVAQFGSTTAPKFSDEDQQLFRTMAYRARTILVHSQLIARQLDEEKRHAEFERQLVGIVSHDLRNPLGVIAMAASLLLGHVHSLDTEALQRVALIRTTAERAARLVGELLDFTRARLGGKIPIYKRPANLHVIARQATEEAQILFPERRIVIESQGHGGAFLDEERMAQVFSNLLSNALKYSPAKSIVHLRTSKEGDWLDIRVHNEGDPISPEFLPHLFEPMQTTTSGQKGLGLGLFIVAEVVRAHGGTITVESSADAGTTFVIKLPAE